jgi:hypothetical protein
MAGFRLSKRATGNLLALRGLPEEILCLRLYSVQSLPDVSTCSLFGAKAAFFSRDRDRFLALVHVWRMVVVAKRRAAAVRKSRCETHSVMVAKLDEPVS